MNPTISFQMSRPWILGSALALGLVMSAPTLPGADLPARPPDGAEFKLLVTAANTAQALRTLELNPQRAVKQTVCFFDSPDGALDSAHLILRARQSGDGPGQSTAKLRASQGDVVLSATEQAIPLELEWVHPTQSMLSRSLDAPLAKDMVSMAAAGEVPSAGLFNEAQRQLVTDRTPEFKWESLHCYGPIDAQLWRQQRKFPGFPNKVTIELWHLRKDAKTLDLLEVSAKAKAVTEAQAQVLASQFYAAAKAAGMGEPAGLTKTRLVLDFFKPATPGNTNH
jgi:hypothetical protein